MIAHVITDRTKIINAVGDEENLLPSKVILPRHPHARHVPTLLHMGAVELAVEVIGPDASGIPHGAFVTIPEIARALFEVGLVVEPLNKRPKQAPAAAAEGEAIVFVTDVSKAGEAERPKAQVKGATR
jgi:hypothetical protein